MRSKRPQSRRRKKRPAKLWTPPRDWTPLLWGALLLNLLLGLALSPVTGLSTVRVVGAPQYDRDRLRAVLGAHSGAPYLQVDRERIESAALQNLAVERANYRANLFGRGVLDLTYKRPVAKIADAEGLYLSSGGSAFPVPVAPNLAVTVVPPYDVTSSNLAIVSSWRSVAAARMCENIGERLPDREWRLVVSRTGFVELEPDSGGTVEFGSFEHSDQKVEALERILKDDPDVLRRVRRLVLTSPGAPVQVR